LSHGLPVSYICAESRSLGLKTYQLAFATQLRARPIYFNFQSDTLCIKDSFALESFCGVYNDFEKSGLGGDLKENIRHLALGTDCASRKILLELSIYERLKSLFLEIPRWENWRMEAEVENLEATWRSRLEGAPKPELELSATKRSNAFLLMKSVILK
jgi:hypothetical protein